MTQQRMMAVVAFEPPLASADVRKLADMIPRTPHFKRETLQFSPDHRFAAFQIGLYRPPELDAYTLKLKEAIKATLPFHKCRVSFQMDVVNPEGPKKR